MTTPMVPGTALSEQDKAYIEANTQLPWTPQLHPLAIRRPGTLICEQQPAGTPSSETSPYLPESVEDPITPRNQGIPTPTLGAPLCPPPLGQRQ